ncbi:MAG: menaquinone biosynthesis protein [Chloroflexi bacterium]|nr:menaquinone biosynthesis protein [Chloroflexota bacterium]MBT7080400.1 menaquinone biosynthesis protein [Chloroflexota bacterium]MBT7289231.1 menaquinone biosynthesis protein [Chloroflexota bacterium]
MKLGYIDYLNCYPFYYHMFEHQSIDGVDIVAGYPTDLNRMMISGQLDMSPISAATCAQLGDDVVLLPDFCLSSEGYVGSVVLRSKVPIEDLDGRIVGVSSASHTSVVLLKILLEYYYDVKPVYFKTDPNPELDGMDAVLLIGNDAMIESREPVSYSYDLGELWLRKTGFPVVFAVFAVRKSSIKAHSLQINAVINTYHESLRCLDVEPHNVISSVKQRYPGIVYDISDYYRTLQFQFTNELKNALNYYLDMAAKLGLLDSGTAPEYLEWNADLSALVRRQE